MLLVLAEGLELLVAVGLLLALLDEVPDDGAAQHLPAVEYLVKVLLELSPALLDVFGVLVGDAEDLFLREGRPTSLSIYRFLMLLSSRASWTLLSSLYLLLKVHSSWLLRSRSLT